MMRNVIVKITIWTFWIAFTLMVIRTNISTDYHLPYAVKKIVMSFFPQGWGFFTRNPQEGITEAFRVEPDGDLSPVTIKNASASNLFGFSRDGRFAGIDLIFLLDEVSEEKWVKGKGDFRMNLPDEHVEISPEKPLQHFPAGDYVLYRYEPIPFLWARRQQEDFRPYQVMKIKINEADIENEHI